MRVRLLSEAEVDEGTPIGLRNGLDPYAARLKTWWSGNPFRDQFQDVPAGWILETDAGEGVGISLNQTMMCELDGQPIRLALHSSLAVDPAYRGKSLVLFTKFVRQSGVDLGLTGSASPPTAKVYSAIAKRIPSPGDDVPLMWPIDYRKFAEAVLKRKRIQGASLLSWPAAAVLAARDLVPGSGASGSIRVNRLDRFDDRFDTFWDRLRQGPPRLRAIRNRAALEWRFAPEKTNGKLTILVVENGRELVGYAVLVQQRRVDFDLMLSEFHDLQAVNDNPETIRALIAGALRASREDKSAILKLRGWNLAKREIALSMNPLSYVVPHWQSFYTCMNPALSDTLAKTEIWDFSPFEIF